MSLFIFSQLIGKPIVDTRQEKVAVLKDIIVRINQEIGKSEETYPPVAGLLAHTAGRDVWLPANQVAAYEYQRIHLSSVNVNLARFARRNGEILLGRDVLDKQLVDVEGRRVIRVNDLALGLLPDGNDLRLVAVDISLRALTRRILFSFSGEHPRRRERLLDWADVQYFASHAPAVKLDVSHERLGKLRPADLARILDELSHQQRDEVIRRLDDNIVADTLEELSSNEAADILEEIGDERASDILEEMRPDAAADVVADMDDEKAEALLKLMQNEESEDVWELLAYSKDTAGGLMTNEFLMLPAQLSASEVLQQIREQEEQPEFVDYIYVCEPGTEHLLGAASLHDIAFCPDRQKPLEQLMEKDIISVHPTTSAREAAALLAEYGLRALPVVDDSGTLVGIITFDDALAVLLPDALRERVAKIFTYRRGRKSTRVVEQAKQRVRRHEEEMA